MSFHQLGLINQLKNNSVISFEYYFRALEIWQNDSLWKNENNSHDAIYAAEARTLGNIGALYSDQGNVTKALDFYFKALKISEALNDKKGMAAKLTNIGNLYANQKEYSRSLEFYQRALPLYEVLGDRKKTGYTFLNIGSVYFDLKSFPNAIENSLKALKIFEETGDNPGLSKALSNIATVYDEQNNHTKALSFYEKALRVISDGKDDYSLSVLLGNIGNTYLGLKDYKEAEKHMFRALQLSNSIGNITLQKDHNKFLYLLYSEKGDSTKALRYFLRYSIFKDSLFSIEKSRDLTKKDMSYEFEKIQLQAKIDQDKKDAKVAERENRQKLIIYSVSACLLLVILLVLLIYRGYRAKQRANSVLKEKNALIVEQKKLVDEKQKEILDSIRYAKRIQTALITSEKYFSKQLSRLKKD